MSGLALWGAGMLAACDGEEEDPPARSCEEVCEASKQCPEGSGPEFEDDCATSCANYRKVGDAAGCRDAVDSAFECLGEADKDVCDAVEGCSISMFQFAFCVGPYCSEHETLPECKGVSCSSSATSGMDCTVATHCSGEPEFMLTCAGVECTCATDGVAGATVPYNPDFCEGEIDAQVDAATAACGWES